MKITDIVLAIGIFIVLAIIVIPLNPFLLDFFISINILLSVLLLGTGLFLNKPTDLAVLPTLILAATMFRLALNISSTRMILSTGQAGKIIDTFGTVVAAGDLIVGFILFVLLTVVQFLVIVKGSERIAEVSARFTLDAMPGKQMSIDGELNMGLMTPEEAQVKRRELEKESALMGSMDGASKFIKGDSIAGIIMTVINMLGGLGIGILRMGYDPAYAAKKYIILSIGDALGAMVPALVTSVATAIIVTRTTSSGESLSTDTIAQFLKQPTALIISGGLFAMLGFIPGMPWYLFFISGAIIMFVGISSMQQSQVQETSNIQEQIEESAAPPKSPEEMYSLLGVDVLSIRIGANLIEFADPASGGRMIEEIGHLRQAMTMQYGYILPPCRIEDSRMIGPYQYQIVIRGNPVTIAELYPQKYMILKSHWDNLFDSPPQNALSGYEPVQKEEAYWVDAPFLDQMIQDGTWNRPYATPIQALTYHLVETVILHIDELFTKVDVRRVIDQVRSVDQALIDNLIPHTVSVSAIKHILVNLLTEKVSIKDIHYIMERLEDLGEQNQDAELLSEKVRMSLSRQICTAIAPHKHMLAITFDPSFEEQIEASIQRVEEKFVLTLEPEIARYLTRVILDTNQDLMSRMGRRPVVICNPAIRLPLARAIHTFDPQLSVISFTELLPEFQVEVIQTVSLENMYAQQQQQVQEQESLPQ